MTPFLPTIAVCGKSDNLFCLDFLVFRAFHNPGYILLTIPHVQLINTMYFTLKYHPHHSSANVLDSSWIQFLQICNSSDLKFLLILPLLTKIQFAWETQLIVSIKPYWITSTPVSQILIHDTFFMDQHEDQHGPTWGQMRKKYFMLVHEYKDLSSWVPVFIVFCYIWTSKVPLYLRFLGTNLISNICLLSP